MNKILEQKKVSLWHYIGYGAGGFGESLAYNVFYFYFIYFLTNIAGIEPLIAGIISLVAVFWDGITDPIIGYVSDNLRSKYGRRRPLMILFCIPLGISIMLLFTNINVPNTIKVI